MIDRLQESKAKPKDQSRSQKQGQEIEKKPGLRSSQPKARQVEVGRVEAGQATAFKSVGGLQGLCLLACINGRVFGLELGLAALVSGNRSSRWRTSEGWVCSGDIDLMERQAMCDVQMCLSRVSAVFAWSRNRRKTKKSRRRKRVELSCEIQSKTRQTQDRASRVEVRPGQIE